MTAAVVLALSLPANLVFVLRVRRLSPLSVLLLRHLQATSTGFQVTRQRQTDWMIVQL